MIEIIPNASRALKEIHCTNCNIVFRATLDEFNTTKHWVHYRDNIYKTAYKKSINCPNCHIEIVADINTNICLD